MGHVDLCCVYAYVKKKPHEVKLMVVLYSRTEPGTPAVVSNFLMGRFFNGTKCVGGGAIGNDGCALSPPESATGITAYLPCHVAPCHNWRPRWLPIQPMSRTARVKSLTQE